MFKYGRESDMLWYYMKWGSFEIIEMGTFFSIKNK